jgi:hypothetical protein
MVGVDPNKTMVEVPIRDVKAAIGIAIHYKEMVAQDPQGPESTVTSVEEFIERLKEYHNTAVALNGGDPHQMLD